MAKISHPNEPTGEIENSISMHNTPNDPPNKPPLGVGASVRSVNAQEEQPHSTNTEECRQQRWKTVREWTAITVSIMAAGFSFGSCLGSNRSADVAKKSLAASMARDRLDQRAWIGAESVSPDPPVPVVGQKYFIHLQIRNSGKTPAKSVLIKNVMDPLPPPGKPNFSYPDTDAIEHSYGMIPPNGTSLIPFSIVTERSTGEDVPITKKDYADLRDGKYRLYMYGRISYADVFGECHWVTFCYYLRAPDLHSFAMCSEYNDTGEEECKENK